MEKQTNSAPRHYPTIYERVVPLALIFILVAMVILFVLTLAVAFHLL